MIEKILVFSFSFIGDAALSTAVISPLRQRFPDAKITFLVGVRAFGLLAADPQIDQVLVYDNLGEHAGWRGKIRLIKSLRRERFDLVVDLRDSLWSRFVGDVLVDGEVADQVEALEDEADLPVAGPRPVGLAELRHRVPVEGVVAGRGRVEQAQDREQRRLAAAGGPGDGHVLPREYFQGDPVEGVGLDLVRVEDLRDVLQMNQRERSSICAALRPSCPVESAAPFRNRWAPPARGRSRSPCGSSGPSRRRAAAVPTP